MSVVEDQIRLGDDALANQFITIFPSGIPGGGNADAVSLRMDQPFDPPSQVIYTYEIDYKGDKIKKTGRKNDTDKIITISVRIDQNWNIYDDIMRWMKLCYDPVTNTALSDENTRIPLVIQSIDGDNNIVKNFKYTQCKLFTTKVTSFDPTTGDPLRMELTFIYGDLDDSVTI